MFRRRKSSERERSKYYLERAGLVINYGEVRAESWKDFGLDTGLRVKAGQPIAFIGKMVNDSMCHFETYRQGTKRNFRYQIGEQPPLALLNPTKYLLHLAAKEHPADTGNRSGTTQPYPSSSRPSRTTEIVSRPQDHIFSLLEGLPNFSGLDRFHAAFPGGVRWRLTPKGIELEGYGIERNTGDPYKVTKIWETFSSSINRWAEHFRVPCVLIVATIATETSGRPDSIRREPGYISDEETPARVSVGLMQTLIATARGTLKDKTIDQSWLLVPDNSIQAGTAYIAEQKEKTGYDPPKVACAYNAGNLLRNAGAENRWKMKQYPIGKGEHCDRFLKWFNDAVTVLADHKKKPAVPYDVYLI